MSDKDLEHVAPPMRGTGSQHDAGASEAWEPVTRAGQVKVGDNLRFKVGDSDCNTRAKLILHAGTDKEEVIYDKGRNFYFITSMVVSGKSNHKGVQVLASGSREGREAQDNRATLATPAADVGGLTPERVMALYDEAIGKGGSADNIILNTARAIEREVLATRPSVDLSGLTEIAGVNIERLMRNLEETSYNEGSEALACRLSDCREVIKAMLATKAEEAVQPARSPDWLAYHSALSASAGLLDNMADGDPITDLPKFLAAKLVNQSWIIADPHGVIARLRTATQSLLDEAGKHIGWKDDNALSKAAEEADQALAACVGIEDSILPADEQSSMAGAAKGGATCNEALRLFLGAAYPVAPEINPRGYNWSEAHLDQARAAALAAPVAQEDDPIGEFQAEARQAKLEEAVRGWTAGAQEGVQSSTDASAQAALFPERDPSKPADQQGLFRKFDVRRVDGSDHPGCKHYGCCYYVLDLTHDQHAPAAMRAYAAACQSTHPQLAADIVAEFGTQPTPSDSGSVDTAEPLYLDGELHSLISDHRSAHGRENVKATRKALLAHIESIPARVAGVRKDAERYQWLRMQEWFDGPMCVLREPKRVLTSGIGLGADCPSRDRLDAAIDAAMAAHSPATSSKESGGAA
jgi:hypothetical protein